MTVQATKRRTIFDAVLVEPVELIISQPHQALISSASAALIAAEAGTLVPPPFNILMAVGAEWAYLRGFSSGQQVTTPWATRLNWSAVLLVMLYGSLWGLRQFHAISDQPSLFGAVALTLIHILCIGSVTLCSAMTHSALVADEHKRNQQKVALDDERNRRLQDAADALRIETAQKEAQLALWEQGRVAAARTRATIAQLEPRNPAATKPRAPRQPIIVDNVEYPSIQAAADAHGISRQAMSKQLKRRRSDEQN